jgi:hypothetical protein
LKPLATLYECGATLNIGTSVLSPIEDIDFWH